MARSRIYYTCWPCRVEDGREAIPATHRLLVREVGKVLGDEVWGCKAHISDLYLEIIETGRPLDVIVHDMESGVCVIEAHPRQVG